VKSNNLKARKEPTIIPRERLMTLFQLNHRINQISNVQKLLKEILHSAIENVGAERGMIILFDESGEEYRTVASESLQAEDIAFSKTIVKKTVESKKTLLSFDLGSDARFRDATSVRKLNIVSFVCVPLIVPLQNKILGTLYIDQRISVKVFSKQDVSFLEAFANLAAVAISNANLIEQLISENIQLRQEVGQRYKFPGIIGQSKAMQKIFREMKQVLNDNCTILLVGESGTGKELIAKALHYNSNRKNKPFMAINCGALPETLLEAELFGSAKGAYTGAVEKQGLLQATNGGTIFLDEINHTSEAMQVKLLRVLQDKKIRRVGGTKSIQIDVRVVCATNEDLEKAIAENRFRQDFYYRINVVTIHVPPLRKRKDDIPILANHFLQKYCEEKNKRCRGFDDDAVEMLIRYGWQKNNVRELENEIERTVIFIKNGAPIRLRDLSENVRGAVATPSVAGNFLLDNKGKILDHQALEKKYIATMLNQFGGNKAKAARAMGIPRSTLQGKMRRYGLK
jgi:Nif-specific regulatory protein